MNTTKKFAAAAIVGLGALFAVSAVSPGDVGALYYDFSNPMNPLNYLGGSNQRDRDETDESRERDRFWERRRPPSHHKEPPPDAYSAIAGIRDSSIVLPKLEAIVMDPSSSNHDLRLFFFRHELSGLLGAQTESFNVCRLMNSAKRDGSISISKEKVPSVLKCMRDRTR